MPNSRDTSVFRPRDVALRTAPLAALLALGSCSAPARDAVGRRSAATTVTATPGTILGVVHFYNSLVLTSLEVDAQDENNVYGASAQAIQQDGHPACPAGTPNCCHPGSTDWCYSLQVEAALAQNYTLRPVGYYNVVAPSYQAITIPFPATTPPNFPITPPAGGSITAPDISFTPAYVHGAFSASDLSSNPLSISSNFVRMGDLSSTFVDYCPSGPLGCSHIPQSNAAGGGYANYLIGGDNYSYNVQSFVISEGAAAQSIVDFDDGTSLGTTLSPGQDVPLNRTLTQSDQVSGVVQLPDPNNPGNNVPIYNIIMGIVGTTTTPGTFAEQYQTQLTSPTTAPIPYTGRIFNIVDLTKPIKFSPLLTLSSDGITLLQFPSAALDFSGGNQITQNFNGQYATISGRVTLSPPYPIKNGVFPYVEAVEQEVNGTSGLGRTTYNSDANGGSFVMPAFGTPAYAGNWSLWRFGWNLDLGDPNYLATYNINNYLNIPVQVAGGANVTPPAFSFCTSFVDVFFSAPTTVAGTTVSDPQLGAQSSDNDSAFAEGLNQNGVTTGEARMVLRPHSVAGSPVVFHVTPSAQINLGGTPAPGRTSFTPFTLVPSCGDRTVVGVPGPIALTVTAPQEGQVFPVCQIPVTGLATGEPNIAITVNGKSVADPSTGNPADPLQVGFTTTLTPVPGPPTITVTGSDANGNSVSDVRHVSCLKYAPPTISCPGPETVTCTSPAGGAANLTVNLSDPNNLPLQVTWAVDGTTVQTDNVAGGATSDTFTGTVPPYAHTVTATASDGNGNAVSCSTQVTVPAPLVTLNVYTPQLSPISHKLKNVFVGWSSNGDTCVHLASHSGKVFSNEADVVPGIDGQYSPDEKVGPDIYSQYLRAEADPAGSGRVYLYVFNFTDTNGHTATACGTTTVPLDTSAASIAAVNALAVAAQATCNATGAPPSGYVQVGTGPAIGPYQ